MVEKIKIFFLTYLAYVYSINLDRFSSCLVIATRS
jgi:hypothetical protein